MKGAGESTNCRSLNASLQASCFDLQKRCAQQREEQSNSRNPNAFEYSLSLKGRTIDDIKSYRLCLESSLRIFEKGASSSGRKRNPTKSDKDPAPAERTVPTNGPSSSRIAAAVAEKEAAIAAREAAIVERDAALARERAALAERDAARAQLARRDVARAGERVTAAEERITIAEERIGPASAGAISGTDPVATGCIEVYEVDKEKARIAGGQVIQVCKGENLGGGYGVATPFMQSMTAALPVPAGDINYVDKGGWQKIPYLNAVTPSCDTYGAASAARENSLVSTSPLISSLTDIVLFAPSITGEALEWVDDHTFKPVFDTAGIAGKNTEFAIRAGVIGGGVATYQKIRHRKFPSRTQLLKSIPWLVAFWSIITRQINANTINKILYKMGLDKLPPEERKEREKGVAIALFALAMFFVNKEYRKMMGVDPRTPANRREALHDFFLGAPGGATVRLRSQLIFSAFFGGGLAYLRGVADNEPLLVTMDGMAPGSGYNPDNWNYTNSSLMAAHVGGWAATSPVWGYTSALAKQLSNKFHSWLKKKGVSWVTGEGMAGLALSSEEVTRSVYNNSRFRVVNGAVTGGRRLAMYLNPSRLTYAGALIISGGFTSSFPGAAMAYGQGFDDENVVRAKMVRAYGARTFNTFGMNSAAAFLNARNFSIWGNFALGMVAVVYPYDLCTEQGESHYQRIKNLVFEYDNIKDPAQRQMIVTEVQRTRAATHGSGRDLIDAFLNTQALYEWVVHLEEKHRGETDPKERRKMEVEMRLSEQIAGQWHKDQAEKIREYLADHEIPQLEVAELDRENLEEETQEIAEMSESLDELEEVVDQIGINQAELGPDLAPELNDFLGNVLADFQKEMG